MTMLVAGAAAAAWAGCGGGDAPPSATTSTGAALASPLVTVIDGYTGDPVLDATVQPLDTAGAYNGPPLPVDGDGNAQTPPGSVVICASVPAYRGECLTINPRRTQVTIRLHDPVVESPEYGGGPSRTRAQPAVDVPVPDGEPIWTFKSRSLLEFPPVTGRGLLVINTNRGRVVAFKAATGHVEWQRRHTTDDFIASSPAIDYDGDAVIVAGMDGRLVSYDLTTGRTRWEYPVGDSRIESSPLIVGKTVYVGAWNGRLYAVSTENGRLRWSYQADADIKGSAALSDGNIVFGDYSGHVYAVDAESGELVWKTRAGKRLYGGPGVSEGIVVIGDVGGAVIGLDAATGAVKWRRPTKDFVYASPAIADGTVFIGSYDHMFRALDLKSGKQKWARDLGERISGSATVVGDVVYTSILTKPGVPRRTYALDVASGEERWQKDDGRYSPAVATGRMVFIVGSSTLYAYRAP